MERRGRKRKGEYKREENIDMSVRHQSAASYTAFGDRAQNPGTYPDRESNGQSFDAWDDINQLNHISCSPISLLSDRVVSIKQDKHNIERKIEAQSGSLASNKCKPVISTFTRWKLIIWDSTRLESYSLIQALLMGNCEN